MRWIRSRSISELIIAPMARSLLAKTLPPAEEGGAAEAALTVLGGSRVEAVTLDAAGKVSGLSYRNRAETTTLSDLDGCVLALGSKGLNGVMNGSPELARAAPELCRAAGMGGIDVIACRLWLDKSVATRTPANVFSRFDSLRGVGVTSNPNPNSTLLTLTLTLTLTQTPTLAPALTLTLTRYRALSLRLHPDRGGDPAAFARVATAHECLLDEAGCRRGFHEGADLAEIGRAAKGGLVDELERSYFPARYPYQPFGK